MPFFTGTAHRRVGKGNAVVKIYDDIFSWEGWGGMLRLASGRCRLRIFDLSQDPGRPGLTHLKPIIVLVTDVPESRMSVRSCAGHIATQVTQKFNIQPQRMVYVEHYPAVHYGTHDERFIPERYDGVEFVWMEGKAIRPAWRPLTPPLLDVVKKMAQEA
ncbi:MAG: hypothetical protein JRI76_05065 [Deltaproteobacteria bacterium]|nr:hypothetical protein [Deltaproteobacteria bacterium]MBW2041388.1 hypothetical protein [Deltaproteobacteria bacterium]MBW2131542.1 hypothetical protein [Deltaproteobacteria bacterium]